MSWHELCVTLNTRFGRDQHTLLIRQFYHIRQTTSVTEYVEQFDQLLHQLLAHENQLNPTMITTRFVDGLKDEVKAVVIIQRPKDLDTTCALGLLQEVLSNMGKREFKRFESVSFARLPSRAGPMPLQLPPASGSEMLGMGEDHRVSNPTGSRTEESKMVVLKAYRKAKGLCFKCGERWDHSHGVRPVYHYTWWKKCGH